MALLAGTSSLGETRKQCLPNSVGSPSAGKQWHTDASLTV
jgi:hypothetical protein